MDVTPSCQCFSLPVSNITAAFEAGRQVNRRFSRWLFYREEKPSTTLTKMPSFQPFSIGFPKQIKIYSFETEWTGSQPKKPPNGLANPTYKPHLDKLDPGFNHLIGEVAPPYKLKTAHDDLGDSIFASITSDEDPLTNPDHAFGLDVGPVNQGADVWTNGSATSVKNALHSDHNHGKRLNWDVICDVGTAIKQDETDLQSDALVQQVNDFSGLINPDSMRPAEYFSHNPEWFAPGSAVESLVPNSDQMFSPISGEGVFTQRDGLGATASVIVGDNHF